MNYKECIYAGLAVPWMCIAAITYYAYTLPACFPWPDAALHEPLTCSHTPTRVVQTVSEMTARTGMTAELLSAAAAAALIGVYAALAFIRERLPSTPAVWHVVDATFAVGALGFVGLTVWSLRVNGMVHTCFTSQTILAIFIQATILCQLASDDAVTLAWFIMLVAMAYYAITSASDDMPEPTVAAGYFDAKHYRHAYGQFVFFSMYFLLLALVVGTTRTHKGTHSLFVH